MTERFGVVPTDLLKSVDGLTLLRRVASGDLPAPTMAQTLDFKLVEVEHGRAVFSGTPSAHHLNPMGTVHGGYGATLLDSCMACAVHSTLPAGTGYTTLEFKVNLVRAMTETTREVRAEGRVVHVGRRVATAEGTLSDREGRLLAHATTTCMLFPL
ncbi:MAG: PaaI family thioesterase [Alphaproteobacteria bacterium]|nr:MAG: PaaI family thioesterase [Alphaproteobacteria bacterium]